MISSEARKMASYITVPAPLKPPRWPRLLRPPPPVWSSVLVLPSVWLLPEELGSVLPPNWGLPVSPSIFLRPDCSLGREVVMSVSRSA